MKKFGLIVLVACATIAICACGGREAAARPPYPAMFLEQYKDNAKVVDAAKEAKCTVCHGMDKKKRNDYAKAVEKFQPKKDFDELKGDKEALAKKLAETFKKVEDEKSAGGEKFGELLKAGKLPGTKIP